MLSVARVANPVILLGTAHENGSISIERWEFVSCRLWQSSRSYSVDRMLKPMFLGVNNWNVLIKFQEMLSSLLQIASWNQECARDSVHLTQTSNFPLLFGKIGSLWNRIAWIWTLALHFPSSDTLAKLFSISKPQSPIGKMELIIAHLKVTARIKWGNIIKCKAQYITHTTCSI